MLSKGLLLAVDANSLLHRAYHAYPPTLTTTDGQLVNAVYGFTSMFLDAVLLFKPEYVFCAFDTKKPTFRHTAYVGYKANRPKTDSELIGQIPYVFDVLRALNIPVFTIEGYEADDILGTIATKVANDRNSPISHVNVLTGDRDLFQLVNDKIQTVMPKGSFKNLEEFDEMKVMTSMGVTPSQIVELKGLMGDSSDNIPGVKGIGPKTATELLNKYRTIDEIYKNIDKVEVDNKRIAKLLIENHESAIMSRGLATIELNTPVTFSADDAETKTFNPDEVSKLFMKLQFKSLIPRLKMLVSLTGNNLGETKIEKEVDEKALDIDGNVLFTKNRTPKWTVIEVKDLDFFARVEQLKSLYEVYKYSVVIYSQEKLYIIENLLSTNAFNGKLVTFGVYALLSYGQKKDTKWSGNSVNFLENILDFELLSYILQTGRNDYTLQEDVTEAGLGILENGLNSDRERVLGALKKRIARTMQKVETYDALERVSSLWTDKKETDKVPVNIATKEDMLAAFGVALMHHRGVTIDLIKVKETVAEFREKVLNLEQEIYDIVGFEFNIRSPKQLANVLFSNLNLPHGRKTKTGFSTDDELLTSIKSAHPVVSKIVEFRELAKLVSTYMEPYLELAKAGSLTSSDSQMSMFGQKSEEFEEFLRVHSTFNIIGTSSGRLSSSNPNLQNLPTKTDIGKSIRRFFVPTKGAKLVSIDYSQIDLRVLAHISEDEGLVNAFKNNEDIHRSTASKIFHVEFSDVTDKQRRFAKTINFGLIYGMSSFGLSKSLDISVEEAGKFIEEYFKQFPLVRKYMADTTLFARDNGYVVSLLGRRRYIAGIDSNIRARAKAAEREAINMPIQGGADDIMRLALGQITQLPEVLSGECPLILQVHDEFVFEMKDDTDLIEEKSTKIQQIMQQVIKLKIPLRADIEVGESLDM